MTCFLLNIVTACAKLHFPMMCVKIVEIRVNILIDSKLRVKFFFLVRVVFFELT